MSAATGNILGNPRAESDRLLTKAFVETADFRALVETDDFHIVVGRRGTGKSALFQKVQNHFEAQSRVHVHAETPREHFALAVQAWFARANHNYRTVRAACRILWRSYILAVLARTTQKYSRMEDYKLAQQIRDYFEHILLFPLSDNAYEFMLKAMERHVDVAPTTLPSILATSLKIEELEGIVRSALQATHNR